MQEPSAAFATRSVRMNMDGRTRWTIEGVRLSQGLPWGSEAKRLEHARLGSNRLRDPKVAR